MWSPRGNPLITELNPLLHSGKRHRDQFLCTQIKTIPENDDIWINLIGRKSLTSFCREKESGKGRF